MERGDTSYWLNEKPVDVGLQKSFCLLGGESLSTRWTECWAPHVSHAWNQEQAPVAFRVTTTTHHPPPPFAHPQSPTKLKLSVVSVVQKWHSPDRYIQDSDKICVKSPFYHFLFKVGVWSRIELAATLFILVYNANIHFTLNGRINCQIPNEKRFTFL